MYGLGLIKYFYFPAYLISASEVLTVVFNFLFFVGLGLLVGKDFKWIKYILLILTVFGLINMYSRFEYTLQKPDLINIIVVAQRVILLLSTILVFVAPKAMENNVAGDPVLEQKF